MNEVLIKSFKAALLEAAPSYFLGIITMDVIGNDLNSRQMSIPFKSRSWVINFVIFI